MSSKDYYPIGAYNDPRAPYNQDVEEEKEFVVNISHRFYKAINVYTYDYDIERDDEGSEYVYCGDGVSDFKNQHYTLSELLEDYKEILKKKVESLAILQSIGEKNHKSEIRDLMRRIEDASGWEDEIEKE